MKHILRRLWISLSIAFFSLLPYLFRFNSAYNRFLFFWNRGDAAAIFAAVALIASIIFLLSLMFSTLRNNIIRNTTDLIFIIWTLFVILRIVDTTSKTLHPDIYTYILFPVVTAAATIRLFSLKKMKTVFISSLLILSGTVPVFFITSLSYRDILPDTKKELLASESNQATATNIYIFVFDEWSYTRTFTDDTILPEYKNLAQLQERSTVFTNALAHGTNTKESMPSFLLQKEINTDLSEGYFDLSSTSNERIDIKKEKTIFELLGNRNTKKIFMGFLLPYGEILGNHTDICRSYTFYKNTDNSIVKKTLYHIISGLDFLCKPYSLPWTDKLNTRLRHTISIDNLRFVHSYTKSLIRKDTPVFAFIHYPVPHFPFIFKENGTIKQLDKWHMINSTDDYKENLLYTDKLIGEILDILKENGKFDSSLLIFTSDHSWRWDPAAQISKEDARHVPLFIKFPNQTSTKTVTDIFYLKDLSEFISRDL